VLREANFKNMPQYRYKNI